ncbi:pyruvate dehydrogenase E1 subunit alpha [Clostridia bacterium]|nr:pyruvate dehydrogenase E1 subunit alpha [Clostridia bacterium]
MADIQGILDNKEFMAGIMENLMLVRKFEEQVYALYEQGKLHGTTHLGVGEEATGVGSCFALKPQDCVLTSHRGHGQTLAKGADPKDMMAEILGKEAGTNRGRGGSLHIASPGNHVFGTGGIIGASCPVACGMALAFKMCEERDRVAAVFFGDGATSEGAVHEAFNLAAVWQLPVLFICTNNGYAMSTPLRKAVNDMDLTKRAIPFGIRSYEVDGNDVLSVYATVSEARQYVVSRQRPAFIVEHTYRTSGHSKSDVNRYRTREEIAEWYEKNPVSRFSKVLLANGFSQEEIDGIDAKSTGLIAEAVAYAETCPYPAATTEELNAEAYAK